METASLSVIEFASKYKDSLLFDRYQAGRDQIALGKRKPPYAYVIPQQQRDPVAAVVRRRAVLKADGAGRDGGRDVSRRHLGDSHRSGICRDGARGARRAGVSGSA